MNLDFLTADDIKILDAAYEGYGGLYNYLLMELQNKLKDFIRQEQWGKINLETAKAGVLAELEKSVPSLI